jgi:hypothetical protein
MEGQRGRPTLYTEKIAAEILERIASGESLKSICRGEHLPAEATVRAWALDDKKGFSARFARAWEIRAEALAEDVLEISDGSCADMVDVQRAKLRVDSRKWLLSKMLPKKYGDSTKIEHTGAEGGPLAITITETIVDPRADDSA